MLPFFAKLPSCLVGIEACGTSHHWARELIKLGHEVRLMPPAYFKPYVKRGRPTRPMRKRFAGGDAADNAVRAREVARAAGGAVDAPDA
jgi:transposase